MSSSKRNSVHKKGPSQSGSRRDPPNSDSGFAQDYTTQYNSPHALREALDAANIEVAHLRSKIAQAGNDAVQKSKDFRELKGQYQGLMARCEVLEDDKAKLINEKRNLRQENESLRDEIKNLRHRSSPTRESPPVMTGAAGPSAMPKVSRSMSKKDKESKKESKDQTQRLSQRFDRSGPAQEGPAPPRVRPESGSYYEGWGPGGRTRRSSSVSAPTVRIGASYTTTHEPVFSSPRQLNFSNVPRNFNAEYDAPYEYEHDGGYVGHDIPLPDKRGRR